MNNISIHSIDTVCLKETCPVHHLCARFERYQKLRKSEKVFSILNPDHIACSEQGCAYRLQKKIIRMARGFRRMFGTIPSANTPHFWFSILNPDHIACSEQGCAYRLQKKIIRMARGFRRMFGTIPSANTPHFWHFSPYISESTYCKAKRGAILIAPDMQQKLLRLFEQNLFALYQRKHLLQGEARRHPHRTRYAAEITASLRAEWRRYQHRFR